MVRQVAGERVFAPLRKRQPDEALICRVLQGSPESRVPEAIARRWPCSWGRGLVARRLSSGSDEVYFTTAPEGAEALARYGKLSAWWCVMLERNSVQAVATGLPAERPAS